MAMAEAGGWHNPSFSPDPVHLSPSATPGTVSALMTLVHTAGNSFRMAARGNFGGGSRAYVKVSGSALMYFSLVCLGISLGGVLGPEEQVSSG